jgi:hypothetical protein
MLKPKAFPSVSLAFGPRQRREDLLQPLALYSGVFTMRELPSGDGTRWGRRRKAELVAAVNCGRLSAGEACSRYRMTPEELFIWRIGYALYGVDGLLAKRTLRDFDKDTPSSAQSWR